MSSDWIKMRTDIFTDPKVIAMAEFLANQKNFIQWILPFAPSPRISLRDSLSAIGYESVTLGVTVTGLLVTWGVTRRDGVRDEDDLILEHCSLNTLDRIAGVPSFGIAMQHIGWAVIEGGTSIRFPKCLIHLTSPEEREREKSKERKRRQREKEADKKRDNKRDESRACHGNVTPRVEEFREVKEGASTVWVEGLQLLTSRGDSEKDARRFLGSCLKDWDEGYVADALRAAESSKGDPKGYVRKILGGKPKKSTGGMATGLVA